MVFFCFNFLFNQGRPRWDKNEGGKNLLYKSALIKTDNSTFKQNCTKSTYRLQTTLHHITKTFFCISPLSFSAACGDLILRNWMDHWTSPPGTGSGAQSVRALRLQNVTQIPYRLGRDFKKPKRDKKGSQTDAKEQQRDTCYKPN